MSRGSSTFNPKKDVIDVPGRKREEKGREGGWGGEGEGEGEEGGSLVHRNYSSIKFLA